MGYGDSLAQRLRRDRSLRKLAAAARIGVFLAIVHRKGEYHGFRFPETGE
jgi:hypothetical protein